MTSAKQAVPLFLSSSRDESGDSDETSFTVRLQPPLRISDKATKVSAYIDSATVPYSFPNLTSSTAKVVVRMPLGAGYGNSGEVTLTLPTGVYDLTEIAEQLNSAVNTYLHTNGYPILTGDWKYYDFSTNTVVTATDKPNFCSFLPDFHKNRIKLILNHDDSEIDFADTDTSLDDLLGFTSKCSRSAQAHIVVPVGGYSISGSFRTLVYEAPKVTWENVDFTVAAGTYTATSLALEINTKFIGAVAARGGSAYDNPLIASLGAATATNPLIKTIRLEPSEEVPGEFRVDFDYANFTFDTAGSCQLGKFDANSLNTNSGAEIALMKLLVGNVNYFASVGDHTRASGWTGGVSTSTFTAENAATIDKVTEVGIAAPGLAHGSYSANGSTSGATLARFQVTGGPGSNMVFRPPLPIKVDVSHLIGGTLTEVKMMLVDQLGLQIDSLLGEKFSVVLVIESE
eukprot:COSAG06_NODE_505_length_14944_cov_17.290901_2_plen_457_part_00